jgi:hypothetical protein
MRMIIILNGGRMGEGREFWNTSEVFEGGTSEFKL